jgi:hypothetical protein
MVSKRLVLFDHISTFYNVIILLNTKLQGDLILNDFNLKTEATTCIK